MTRRPARALPAEFLEGHVRPPGWRGGDRSGWRLIDEPGPAYRAEFDPVHGWVGVPNGEAEVIEFDPVD